MAAQLASRKELAIGSLDMGKSINSLFEKMRISELNSVIIGMINETDEIVQLREAQVPGPGERFSLYGALQREWVQP